MVKNPYEDEWSRGRSLSDDGGFEDWPPPMSDDAPVELPPIEGYPNGDVPVEDTVRLSSGRWTAAAPAAAEAPAYGDLTYGADRTAPLPTARSGPADPVPLDRFGPPATGRPPAPDGYDDFGGPDHVDDDFGYGPGDHDDHDDHDDHVDGMDDGFTDFDEDDEDGEFGAEGDARRNAIEWAVVLVGAVLLALLLRAVLLQAFWIPSPSMESTLEVRDRVLVNKLSYRVGDIGRGDIVVFRRTDAEIASNPSLPQDVIKRAIALPGETIEIRNNEVFIDGSLLIEPYLDDGVETSDFGPEVVPDEHIFVMGDNRGLSLDSRFETGPVAVDRVVGRAFVLFWPLDRISRL